MTEKKRPTHKEFKKKAFAIPGVKEECERLAEEFDLIPLKQINISLDAKDFKNLVTGKIVEICTPNNVQVRLALQDIGYALMIDIISEGISKIGK